MGGFSEVSGRAVRAGTRIGRDGSPRAGVEGPTERAVGTHGLGAARKGGGPIAQFVMTVGSVITETMVIATPHLSAG